MERSSIRTISATPVSDSLRGASKRLGSLQHASGAWRDFWSPSGVSDEWVTAYVGAALATSRDASSRARAQAAWKYLSRAQHREGGWGYSASVPCDADSTAWALVLAQRLGHSNSDVAVNGLRFMKNARIAGGVPTYGDNPRIRSYVRASPSLDFSGWTRPHPCVTGVAAQLTALQPILVEDVLATQRLDGSWESYWWFEDAYATAMSVAALAETDHPRARAAIKRAGDWARRRLECEPQMSSFALSLLLAILAKDADGPAAGTLRCAEALIAHQARDGGWRGSARLRIPAPHDRNPSSTNGWRRWWGTGDRVNIFSLDQCSLFTTATAFSALQLHYSRTNRDTTA